MRRTRFLAPGVIAVAFGLALALGLAGCGSSASTTTSTGAATDAGASTPTTKAPLPAGATPSQIATMVCSHKARFGISSALGETASLSKPTWVDHLYSCRYEYPSGSFTMSIKELSSWSQTLAYFHGLGRAMGDAGSLGNLGQGAFATRDGSVVVRKDWKVLLVNVASLPPEFGKPPTTRADVAITIADIILGCWAGD